MGPHLDMPRSQLATVFLPSFPPGPEVSTEEEADLIRAELIRHIFEICASPTDSGDHAKLVLESDLQRIGQMLGLRPHDWSFDFQWMSEGETGLNAERFARLLNDRDGLFYCSGHRLSRVLGSLEHEA